MSLGNEVDRQTRIAVIASPSTVAACVLHPNAPGPPMSLIHLVFQPGIVKTLFQNPELMRPGCSTRLAQLRHAAHSWKAWKCSPNRS